MQLYIFKKYRYLKAMLAIRYLFLRNKELTFSNIRDKLLESCEFNTDVIAANSYIEDVKNMTDIELQDCIRKLMDMARNDNMIKEHYSARCC